MGGKTSMFFDIPGVCPRLLGLGLAALTTACTVTASGETDASKPNEPKVIAVDVAIAKPKTGPTPITYTGTTAPIKEVLLRSQIQGQLLKLRVEVGDRVQQGQILGQQDDDILTGGVNEARAQREAQLSEVASARRQAGAVKTQVEQARLGLIQAKGNVLQLRNASLARIEEARLQAQQTRTDAQRLSQLAKDGAISQQEAEQARTQAQQAQQNWVNIQASSIQEITQAQTAVKTAQQVLQASEAQVAIEQSSIDAARKRVFAQQATLNQVTKQRSYAVLKAPINGVVMERLAEEGNLLQVGDDIVRLGDFQQVKVIVQVSERLLSQLRIGQKTQVTLDAFPQRSFTGKIARISPLANATSRLLPVEIVMANNGKIGGGLLARVNLSPPQKQPVQVPASALQTQQRGRPGPPGGKPQPAQTLLRQKPLPRPTDRQATLFVLDPDSPKPQVVARSVILGEQRNGQVEIVQGLNPGESFVSRSSGPLKDGDTVRLSILSESPPPEGQ